MAELEMEAWGALHFKRVEKRDIRRIRERVMDAGAGLAGTTDYYPKSKLLVLHYVKKVSVSVDLTGIAKQTAEAVRTSTGADEAHAAPLL